MGWDFSLTWPQWQPPPEGGVVALATHADATFGWAEARLAHLGQNGDGVYVWASGGGTPERCALALLDRPGVVAVTLAPARADVRWVGLAMEVAAWLGRSRCEPSNGGRPAAHVTSSHPPVVPPGSVRIPHLVTVRRGDHLVTDEVVWELVPAAALRRLGELPDMRLVERNLPNLLRLRAAARAGRLPMTAAAGRLVTLLDGGDLSIDLVLRRFDLFRALLSRSNDP